MSVQQPSGDQGILRITQLRSTIGRPKDQGATLRSLGLRRIRHTVERPNNAVTRGMVAKVSHLVEVEAVSTAELDMSPDSKPTTKPTRQRRATV